MDIKEIAVENIKARWSVEEAFEREVNKSKWSKARKAKQ